MRIIMGGTGHVGSAAADALLRRGEPVTVLTRHADKAARWRAKGAQATVVDARDAGSLHSAFRSGRRALVVNPPGDPAGDTDAAEHQTVEKILAALEDSGLEKVVAISTYGAQPGERIGDLGTLWGLEVGLGRLDVPAAVMRGAYYLTNWDAPLSVAGASGVLPSMLPADLVTPMVAPADLGSAAAERLLSPVDDVDLEYVEGPERYTPADVASAASDRFGRRIQLSVTPAEGLEEAFLELGFSSASAASYAGMTRRTTARTELPDQPRRAHTSLHQYVDAALVGR